MKATLRLLCRIYPEMLIAVLVLPTHVQAQQTRTVQWYVNHPSALDAVSAACKNDPGHGRHAADCWNADEARIEVNIARAHRAIDMTPPSDPRYWVTHPNELAFKLKVCPRMPAQAQAANFCPSAMMAGAGR
jgi:hypothetical protein